MKCLAECPDSYSIIDAFCLLMINVQQGCLFDLLTLFNNIPTWCWFRLPGHFIITNELVCNIKVFLRNSGPFFRVEIIHANFWWKDDLNSLKQQLN